MQGMQGSTRGVVKSMEKSYSFDKDTIVELMNKPGSNLQWAPTMDFKDYERSKILDAVVNKGTV
jgi:hypothetical protein